MDWITLGHILVVSPGAIGEPATAGKRRLLSFS
jgi:hypothetical protein